MDWTAQAIIDLPLGDAAQLLGSTPFEVAKSYKALALVWHPDRNADPIAKSVFARVNELRAALKPRPKVKDANVRIFTFADANPLRMKFLTRRAIDTGEVLVGSKTIAYLIDPGLSDLATNAAAHAFKFVDDAIKKQMTPLLPQLERHLETNEGHLFIFRRTADQILLADLIDHVGAGLDARDVAWMVSCLANLTAYLGHIQFCHGAIGPHNLLVSPKYHSVALTGPVLFGTPFGSHPKGLPERTLAVAPAMGLPASLASGNVDLELLRLTIREIFKDPGGSTLMHNADVPSEMALWLLTPPAGSAVADYAGWERARDKAFGPRKFKDFKVSVDAVYPA